MLGIRAGGRTTGLRGDRTSCRLKPGQRTVGGGSSVSAPFASPRENRGLSRRSAGPRCLPQIQSDRRSIPALTAPSAVGLNLWEIAPLESSAANAGFDATRTPGRFAKFVGRGRCTRLSSRGSGDRRRWRKRDPSGVDGGCVCGPAVGRPPATFQDASGVRVDDRRGGAEKSSGGRDSRRGWGKGALSVGGSSAAKAVADATRTPGRSAKFVGRGRCTRLSSRG